jgi:hypothetical protein
MINNKFLKPFTALRLVTFIMLYTIIIIGCVKYKDPTPITTDKLTTPYCNILTAVNYNWGFPGVPNNSICTYPADLFLGTYIFYDSVLNAVAEYVPFDSNIIEISKVSDSTILIKGLCGSNSSTFSAKATKNYRFSLDSNTTLGQVFCSNNDTINGFGMKNFYNDSNFKFSYNLINNAIITEHKGTFKKQ